MANPSPNLRLLASETGGDKVKPEPKAAARAAPKAAPEPAKRWLPVSDVSRALEVSDRRLRRYLDRHADLIETRRTGRKHLIAGDAVQTLTRIRDLYNEGATARDVDTALARKMVPVTTAKTADRGDDSKAIATAVLTAATAKQLAELDRQVLLLRRKLGEMGSALEQRDRVLRRALMAMVDLFQYNENERQLAEVERDRDSSHHHQRVMLSLQELLVHSRKRRRWW